MTRPQKMLRALSAALWDSDLVSSRLTLAFSEFCWTVMLITDKDAEISTALQALLSGDFSALPVSLSGSGSGALWVDVAPGYVLKRVP